MNHRKNLLFVGLSVAALAAQAVPELPRLFSSHMVLPRERKVPIWGRAEAGERVTVTFAGQVLEAVADASGGWRVELSPLAASGEGRVLRVASEAGSVALDDVVVGDVWLCTGQGNIDAPLRKSVRGVEQVKQKLEPAVIRVVSLARKQQPYPLEVRGYAEDYLAGKGWDSVQARGGNAPAIGTAFALRLTQELGIPIGLIQAPLENPATESLLPMEALRSESELRGLADRVDAICPHTEAGEKALSAHEAAFEAWRQRVVDEMTRTGECRAERPRLRGLEETGLSTHYNAMVAPLVPFPVCGVLLYSEGDDPASFPEYRAKLQALVTSWRALWGHPLPFYAVQLQSYLAKPEQAGDAGGYTRHRDFLSRALDSIPGTGVVVTLDLGEEKSSWQKDGAVVGHRLAALALCKTYGKKIVGTGPRFASAVPEKGSVRVTFSSVGGGLMVGMENPDDPLSIAQAPEGTPLLGFAVAGADRRWHWAKAVFADDAVVVSSPEVAEPIAVRYAWFSGTRGHCNVYNREGLPLAPFRTDDW